MEQANQEITQKPVLPIKTKIAAWWMITLGVVGVIFCVYLILMFIRTSYDIEQMAIFSLLVVSFPISLIIFFLGYLLFIRKKWVWWFNIVMLVIVIVGILKFYFPEWVWILLLIPLILLLLERKNFWKITTKKIIILVIFLLLDIFFWLPFVFLDTFILHVQIFPGCIRFGECSVSVHPFIGEIINGLSGYSYRDAPYIDLNSPIFSVDIVLDSLFIFDILILYFISCFVVWIYDKLRKKSHKERVIMKMTSAKIVSFIAFVYNIFLTLALFVVFLKLRLVFQELEIRTPSPWPLFVLPILAIINLGYWFYLKRKEKKGENVKFALWISLALLFTSSFIFFSLSYFELLYPLLKAIK